VRDRLKTLQANKAPAILRLTDAENAAYASVDEYGHLRLSGMTDSVQERLDTLKKRVDEMRKRRMILDVRECGR
ncbi:TPA: right-handed parallel beta-helix repeat-containing protein, partial [Klebsiella michiganensis]